MTPLVPNLSHDSIYDVSHSTLFAKSSMLPTNNLVKMKQPRASSSVHSNRGIQSRRQFKRTKHPNISPSIINLFNAASDEINQSLTRTMLTSESSIPTVPGRCLASLDLVQYRSNSVRNIFDDNDPPKRPLPLYSPSPNLVSSATTVFYGFECLPSPEKIPSRLSFTCYTYNQDPTFSSIDTELSSTLGIMQIGTKIKGGSVAKSGMRAMFGIYGEATIAQSNSCSSQCCRPSYEFEFGNSPYLGDGLFI